jgi:hypothetical protein
MSRWKWFSVGCLVALAVVACAGAAMLRWRPQWLMAMAPSVPLVVAIVEAAPLVVPGSPSDPAEGAATRIARFPQPVIAEGCARVIDTGGKADLLALSRVFSARWTSRQPRWHDFPDIAAAAKRRMSDPDPEIRRLARRLYAGGSVFGCSLRWLAAQQRADGGWDAASLPVAPGYTPDGVGTTALVLGAFLGAGYDHQTPNEHKRTVNAAIQWLLGKQGTDGRLAPDERDHALATDEICEAYGMTGDPALLQPCRAAVAAMTPPDPDDAASRAGIVRLSLQIGALHSAKSSSLTVPDLARFKAILLTAWPSASADPPWAAEDAAGRSPDGSAFAALLLRFAGDRHGSPYYDRCVALIEGATTRPLAWPALTGEAATYTVLMSDTAIWNRWAIDEDAYLDAVRLGEPPRDGSWDAAGENSDRVAVSAARMQALVVYLRLHR